jgi:hypothetical protein
MDALNTCGRSVLSLIHMAFGSTLRTRHLVIQIAFRTTLVTVQNTLVIENPLLLGPEEAVVVVVVFSAELEEDSLACCSRERTSVSSCAPRSAIASQSANIKARS